MLKTPVALIALSVAAASALAFTVDTKEFFAYYKIPNNQKARVRTSSPYLFLSKKACKGTGIHESFHAKHAISYWPDVDQVRTECWAEISNGTVVTMCPVGDDGKVGNACRDFPRENFIDTKSLPSKPDWN